MNKINKYIAALLTSVLSVACFAQQEDDGPADTTQAVALCAALAEDGITTVVATPHQLGRYDRLNSADVAVVHPVVASAVELLAVIAAASGAVLTPVPCSVDWTLMATESSTQMNSRGRLRF